MLVLHLGSALHFARELAAALELEPAPEPGVTYHVLELGEAELRALALEAALLREEPEPHVPTPGRHPMAPPPLPGLERPEPLY